MMKAGTYYVGDLCYVMHDQWNEVCSLTIEEQTCLSGEFKMQNGNMFAMYGTAYGDGEYFDNRGRKYAVDSGTIGCIETKNVNQEELRAAVEHGLGNVIEFKNSFTTSYYKGVIYFDTVTICTDDDDNEDEGYEGYCDEDDIEDDDDDY